MALRFLNEAQSLTGGCRNRMDSRAIGPTSPPSRTRWGRCLWGLGTAAAHSDVGLVRKSAIIQFERAAQGRSTWPRAMAFAALGAAETARRSTPNTARRGYSSPTTPHRRPRTQRRPDWPWPEPRLTYANAVLPEAMIAAGVALDDPALRQRGLDLLAWLLDHETADGHLSPTPVGGRGPTTQRPAFDQQPIEVSTLADACARAAAVDATRSGPTAVRAAAAWFQGANDAGQVMWDPETGGGFDGLHADGVNLNQGAESTLAVLSTLQQAQRFSAVPQ